MRALPKISPAVTRLAAVVLGAVVLGWSAIRVSRAGAAHRADLREAERTLATFAEWKRIYQPAVAAESIAWRRALMELQALGIIGDERLALTRTVGRAAEAAGLHDVRVLIVPPDTTGAAERLSTEGVRRQMAPFSLVVECRGNLQAVVNFLGQLPPSVSPTHLDLVRQAGRARHRVSLVVYELQLSHAPAALSTPLERGNSGRGGAGRARG